LLAPDRGARPVDRLSETSYTFVDQIIDYFVGDFIDIGRRLVKGEFLIGCGAGFSGDRLDAPLAVVEALADDSRPAAMIFETLAERTLALGHLARREAQDKGYDPNLGRLLRPILRVCVDKRIPIIGNFGAANPWAAARLIRGIARDVGVENIRIAVVFGDDVHQAIAFRKFDPMDEDRAFEIGAESAMIAANVYLGAQSIAEALEQGADVVVTGRVADPALTLGPLAAWFGWRWDDWNSLAAGTMAGHLLECGSQVTGGYHADPGFKDVPRLESVGFPIAEVSADGDIVITKPQGTGGVVNARVVKEQLLYEIHDPSAYLTPDVILDLSEVEVRDLGGDRVLVNGARGRPRPEFLKATVCFEGDWLGEGEISYAGPNALARARLAADVLSQRLKIRCLDVRSRTDLIGALSIFDSDEGVLASAFSDLGEVRVRLAVSARDKETVEESLREVLALYTCGPAGGGGVRSRVQNRIRTASYRVPRDAVSSQARFFEEAI
jgi:Acyclic terpene utilisation family protein AtuA